MPPHSSDAPSPVAYSYVRFSSPQQAKGDSLRRQTEAAAEWAQRNGAHLDTALTLHDLGKSAFTGQHRTNPDRHALALFLKGIETGKVAHGSFLVVENLDRLSREDEVPACHLLTGILMAGVRVVQMKPYEMLLTEKSNGWELMRAVMELSRGHGESAMKSERVGKAWENKRRRARDSGTVLTRNLPGWVREQGGKLVLVPDRAAVVKRIFEMAAGGYGMIGIAKRLNREGVPAFGSCGLWSPQYVHKVLKDRRAVGEFQLRGRGRKPEGDPVPGYYPPVVTEDEWAAARAGAQERRIRPGRTGSRVNVFAGLLHDAVAGGSYIRSTMTENRKLRKPRTWTVLVNNEHRKGKTAARSFPFPTFERAILSCIREIDPAEVLGQTDGPDEVAVLAGQYAQLEADIAKLGSLLLDGDSRTIAKQLRAKEAELADVTQQLATAKQKQAHPLSEAWGEAKGLLEVLDEAPDQEDARLRLRAALRRIVERIDLYVTNRGKDRFAAVEVRFKTDGEVQRIRTYLIFHRPPYSNGKRTRAGGWKVAPWLDAWPTADAPEPGAGLQHTPAFLVMLDEEGVKAFEKKAATILPPEIVKLLVDNWMEWLNRPLNPLPEEP
jgi:DNA invertase Pin-like site-specific DNA recombinase